ncbi:hypothetical protein ACQQ2Q_14790 [Agrobacterium sp. ES01]|uniref:hypothetical protein n=1 Tax=Agrobacterium sp. ES01 TaxID=3420714 RepID=UPI003D143752
MQLELISLDRAGAAAVAGITEAHIADWMAKQGLFPEKQPGNGARAPFMIWDVISLATIKALLDAGFVPAAAVEAIRPYSPYGALRIGEASDSPAVTGDFRLAQNGEGRWVGRDGPDVKVSLQVRMWPIFDEVFPRFCERVSHDAKAVPPEQMRRAIEEYRAEIAERRANRFEHHPIPDA